MYRCVFCRHVVQSREEQALLTAQKKRYDKQLLLNLGIGNTVLGLQGKAEHIKLQTDSIDLRQKELIDFKEIDCDNFEKQLFGSLTNQSRIYIIGHCSPGSNKITSDEDVEFTAEVYAETLAKNLKPLTSSQNSKLRISVIACNSATEGTESSNDSFCDRLYSELNKKGIECEVLGRTGKVSRWDGNVEGYRKLVGGRHQQTGDKVIWEGIHKKPFPYQIQKDKQPQEVKTIVDENFEIFYLDAQLENHPVNLGAMSKESAESMLTDYLEDTKVQKLSKFWLLREDPETHKLILTKWSKKTQAFTHHAIEEKDISMRQLFDKEAIWGSTGKTYMKSNIVFGCAMSLDEKSFMQESKYIYMQESKYI